MLPHPPQEIRFCRSRDGIRIAYVSCGKGPPLLWAQHWIHHLDLDWESTIWRPWLDLLSARFTVVRYDWRGCGLSDRDGVTFSFKSYIEDMEAVAEASGLERFILFGALAHHAPFASGAIRPTARQGQARGRAGA